MIRGCPKRFYFSRDNKYYITICAIYVPKGAKRIGDEHWIECYTLLSTYLLWFQCGLSSVWGHKSIMFLNGLLFNPLVLLALGISEWYSLVKVVNLLFFEKMKGRNVVLCSKLVERFWEWVEKSFRKCGGKFNC